MDWAPCLRNRHQTRRHRGDLTQAIVCDSTRVAKGEALAESRRSIGWRLTRRGNMSKGRVKDDGENDLEREDPRCKPCNRVEEHKSTSLVGHQEWITNSFIHTRN